MCIALTATLLSRYFDQYFDPSRFICPYLGSVSVKSLPWGYLAEGTGKFHLLDDLRCLGTTCWMEKDFVRFPTVKKKMRGQDTEPCHVRVRDRQMI
jgi:hypothetical protein